MQKQQLDVQPQEMVVTVSPGVLFLALAVLGIGAFITYKAISGISPQSAVADIQSSDAVTMKDGKQIITVLARGGYSPRIVTAKADIPTTLVMKTENSFGCERSFRIPKLGVSKNLPESGLTEIDLGIPALGAKIFGTCSMGMYSVTINFN